MDDLTKHTIAAYNDCPSAYLEAWKDARPKDAAKWFAQHVGTDGYVLDVACGPGLDVRLLRDVGVRAVSGDLSLESMHVARTYFPKGLLACWDFRKLPFEDNQFNGVWAPAALMHLPRKEIIPAMRELIRVQAGGPIFLTFPEGDTDVTAYEDEPVNDVYATSLTAETLRALLMRMGYINVEVESRPDPRGRHQRWVHGFGMAPTTKKGKDE